jgi:hypothetical protein
MAKSEIRKGDAYGALYADGTFTAPASRALFAPMFAPPDQAADRVSGKTQRVAVSFPRELIERIDDFRFANRVESRAEAIRQLIEAGLEANSPGSGPHSSPVPHR